MPTPRKPTPPTTAAIDQFCSHFDHLFARYEERRARTSQRKALKTSRSE